MALSQSPSGDETRQPPTTAEKRREYQRQYNLTHKKKDQPGRGMKKMAAREVIHTTFNAEDIMSSVIGQTFKMLDKIVKGERAYTN